MEMYEFLKNAIEDSIDERVNKNKFKTRREVEEFLKELEQDVERQLNNLVSYYLDDNIDDFIDGNGLEVDEVEKEKEEENLIEFYKELFLIAKDRPYLTEAQLNKKLKLIDFYGFLTKEEMEDRIDKICSAIKRDYDTLLTITKSGNKYRLDKLGNLNKL